MGWGSAYMPQRIMRQPSGEAGAALGVGGFAVDIINSILSSNRQDRVEAARQAMAERQMGFQEQRHQDDNAYRGRRQDDENAYRGSVLNNQAENLQRQAKQAAAKQALAEGEQNASPMTGMLKGLGPDLREPEVIPEGSLWNAAAGNAREGRTILAPRYGMSQASMPQLELQRPDVSMQSAKPPSSLAPGRLQMGPVALQRPDEPVSPEQFVTERSGAMSNAVGQARARQAAEKLSQASARKVSPQDYAGRILLQGTVNAQRDATKAGGDPLTNALIASQLPAQADAISAATQARKRESSDLAGTLGRAYTSQTGRPAPQISVPGGGGQASAQPPPGMNRAQAAQWAAKAGLTRDQAQALLNSLPR